MPLPNIEGINAKLLQKLMSLFLPSEEGRTRVGNYPIHYRNMNVAGRSLPGGSIVLQPDMGETNTIDVLRHENAHSIADSLPLRTFLKGIFNEQEQQELKKAYLGDIKTRYKEYRPDNVLANIEGPAILADERRRIENRYEMLAKIVPELYEMNPERGDQYIENLPDSLKKSIRSSRRNQISAIRP